MTVVVIFLAVVTLISVLTAVFMAIDYRNRLAGASAKVWELQNASAKLYREIDTGRAINSCLQSMLSSDDFESARLRILRMTGEQFHAARCRVGVFDQQHSVFCSAGEWCASGVAPATDFLMPLEPSMQRSWFHELETRRSIFINADNGTAGDEKWKAELTRCGIKAFFAVGMHDGERVIGYLGIDFNEPPPVPAEAEVRLALAATHLYELLRDRCVATEKARHGEYEKQLILDFLPWPVRLFDDRGCLVHINRIAAKLLGKSVKDLLHCACAGCFCNDLEPRNCIVRKCLLDQQTHRRIVVFCGHTLEASAYPVFDAAGKMLYVQESAVDCTRWLDEQQRLREKLDEAASRARAGSAFFTTLNHELRTSLSSIIGYCELLRNKKGDDDALEALDFASNNLRELTDNIIEFAKFEAGKSVETLHPTDVAIMLRDTVNLFKMKAMEQRDAIDLQLPAEPPWFLVDPVRLRQILINLVSNAVKFTQNGQISIGLEFVRTSTGAGAVSGKMRISVKDTGCGIAPERLATIFEPFSQTSPDLVREGVGLGLSIAHKLAGVIGARLEIQSELNRGSLFTLTFDNVEFVAPELAEGEAAIPVNASPCPVMLVDDIPMNLRVMAAMLKNLNVPSVSYTSGTEALANIGKDRPRLVLTDLWMPGMDGMALAKALAADEATKSIPVIAVTADSQFQKGREPLFAGILIKPISRASLAALLAKFDAQ